MKSGGGVSFIVGNVGVSASVNYSCGNVLNICTRNARYVVSKQQRPNGKSIVYAQQNTESNFEYSDSQSTQFNVDDQNVKSEHGPSEHEDASSQAPILAAMPLLPFQRVYGDTERGEFARAGSYAIFDARRTLQYLGYSKNVRDKLLLHSRLQRGSCQYFKAHLPPLPLSEISPDSLEAVLDAWVEQNGRIPPGNSSQRAFWEVPAARTVLDDRRTSQRATRSALVPTDNYYEQSERERRARARRYRDQREDPRRNHKRRDFDDDDDLYDDFEFDEVVRIAKKTVAKSASFLNRGARQIRKVYDRLADDYEAEIKATEQRVEYDPLDPFSPSRPRQKADVYSDSSSRASSSNSRRVRVDPQQKRRRGSKYADPDYDREDNEIPVLEDEWVPVALLFGLVTLMALFSMATGGSDVAQVGQQTLPM